MITSETSIRVRYADTDQMKMVYYAKYFEYFEQGRSDLLRKIGVPYPEIEKRGYYLPVIEAFASYRKPARYDDLLTVALTVKEVPQTRIRIEYALTNGENSELLAEGYTVHSFLKASTGRPTRVPAFFLEQFMNIF